MRHRLPRVLPCLLTWAALLGGHAPRSHADATPPTVELARAGQASLKIVVGSRASAATREAADELAHTLGRLSGAAFKVQTSDGSAGLIVGRPADFAKLPFAVTFGTGPLDREDYLLRSHAQGLYLLGASDAGVSHAVWDLLYRFGHRQFFPGPTWEVVPAVPHLQIAVDERQRPAFHARRIWYNWGLWGYNDEPYRQWCRRNRMAKGFDLQSGHAYEGIIQANKAVFDAHPEYYALSGGTRKFRGGDTQLCIANPDLRKLVVAQALRTARQNPRADSLSMEPNDGSAWCECEACARMGSISDRAVTLANDVAAALNGPGGTPEGRPLYVGLYAYNRHAAPPSLKVHPQVIPSATTAFIGGGYTFEQVLKGWQAQGATMGVYDYLSVVDWDWNLPRGASASRPAALAAFLPQIHQQGVRFYDAESGDCWGPCGLGYYVASRVLWDVGAAKQLDALRDDFLTRAFGPAQQPMRAFYHLLHEDTQRRPPSDLVGRMYRHLDAARRASTDTQVLQRLDDLTLYTRYVELYYAHAAGNGSVEAVARHAYRMRQTMMVHSYGLWCRLVSQQAAPTPDHPWKSDPLFTAAERAKILADGIAHNMPVEPGFASVAYRGPLVPADRLKLPTVSAGSFPTAAQDQQRYLVWLPAQAGALDLKVRVQKVWANRPPKISLFSPQEVSLNAVASADRYRPDGKTYAVHLPTPYAGLHRVETVDGGDYTRIDWPAGLPVTVESGIDTPGVTSHFRGPWTLYFYVPKGTKLVGGWAARVANWAPRISGKLRDADGREVLDFAKTEEGWFKVPVPAGQDGRLWKFDACQGQRLLMTVPPYLARRAEELLLPDDVVAADAPR